jgi:hypothetical protein
LRPSPSKSKTELPVTCEEPSWVDRAPQLHEGVGARVLVDDVLARSGGRDLGHLVAVEVGDVGRAALATVGDRRLGQGRAGLAVERVDIGIRDEDDLGLLVAVEVGDPAEAVRGRRGPQHLADEVVHGHRPGERVGRATGDHLLAPIVVEVRHARDRALSVEADPRHALVQQLARGVEDRRAEDDLGYGSRQPG